MALDRIGIDLRIPDVSGDCFWKPQTLTPNILGAWEFLIDVDASVFGLVIVPPNLAASPAAKIILSTAYNATTLVSSWLVRTSAIADGESYDPATLTAIAAQDISIPGTVYLRKEVSFTLATQPVANDELIVEIEHNGAKTEDTAAVNSLLVAAYLEIDLA